MYATDIMFVSNYILTSILHSMLISPVAAVARMKVVTLVPGDGTEPVKVLSVDNGLLSNGFTDEVTDVKADGTLRPSLSGVDEDMVYILAAE